MATFFPAEGAQMLCRSFACEPASRSRQMQLNDQCFFSEDPESPGLPSCFMCSIIIDIISRH